MIKQLVKLSNHLDAKGLTKEADCLDSVIRKIANHGEIHTMVSIGAGRPNAKDWNILMDATNVFDSIRESITEPVKATVNNGVTDNQTVQGVINSVKDGSLRFRTKLSEEVIKFITTGSYPTHPDGKDSGPGIPAQAQAVSL